MGHTRFVIRNYSRVVLLLWEYLRILCAPGTCCVVRWAVKKVQVEKAPNGVVRNGAPTKSAARTSKAPKISAGQSAKSKQASTTTTGLDRFTKAEIATIKQTLSERLAGLQAEHERVLEEMVQRQSDRASDSSGDDQADTGTETFEREQELILANGILERVNQAEHALSRLDNGTYGQCERCGNPIPKARLEAFPVATLCVTCKQLEERR